MADDILRQALADMARQTNATAQTMARLEQILARTGNAADDAADELSDLGGGFGNLTAKISPAAIAFNTVARVVMGYVNTQIRLTKSLVEFRTQVLDTEDTFANMSTAVSKNFEYVADMAGEAGKIIKGLPFGISDFFDTISEPVKETMRVVVAMNDQAMKVLQGVFDGIGNLSSNFGVLTLDMNKFSEQARSAGLTSDQFSRILSENADTLGVALGGNVESANVLGREFNFLLNEGRNTRDMFVAMGMSTDDMANAMSEYAYQQRLSTGRQFTTQGALTNATAEYLKELKGISAITGQNLKDQQAQRRDLLMNAQFQAKLTQMRAAGDTEGAAALQQVVLAAGEFGDTSRKAAIEMAVYGDIRTKESAQFAMMQGGLTDTFRGLIEQSSALGTNETERQLAIRRSLEANEDRIKADRKVTANIAMMAGVTNNDFVQATGQNFIATMEATERIKDSVQTFENTVINLNTPLDGLSKEIADQNARFQEMRTDIEAGGLRVGESTLQIAKAFTELAHEMDKGRQNIVESITEMANSMVGGATLLSTPEGIAKVLGSAAVAQQKGYSPERMALEQEKRDIENRGSWGFVNPFSEDGERYRDINRQLNELKKIEKRTSSAMGGILSGPSTGYRALLHGTEAVVPLPDGKTIPVALDTSKLDASLTAVMDSMAQTSTSQSDKLAGLMEQSVRLNGEILDALKAGNRNGMKMVKAMS